MDSRHTHDSHTALIDLQMAGIAKRFGDQTVISNLSLDVHKGELCCLLGPSGCGKTTTLRIIAGFCEPDVGTVRLGGRDITHLPPQARDVGMVFQNYALFPHLNVYDNIAYGLRRHGWRGSDIKARIGDILQLVELEGYELRGVHELSGGQRQRVALARALIIEPKLLLLDEPLSNLDARLRDEMRQEIRQIQRTLNITTIHVTHDQEEAMSIADRIVLMKRGRIEQVGSPWEIYENPATRFVAAFIGRANMLRGHVAEGTLELLNHRVPVPEDLTLPDGEVLGAVRPERLRLVDAGSTDVIGTVKEAVYLGAIVRYCVALDDGLELDVEVPSSRAVHQPGEPVGVDWRLEDVHFFNDSAGAS